MLSFSTCPSVSRKKMKKVIKKVLTDWNGRGIIYKSSRYGNEIKAKIVRHKQDTGKEKLLRFEKTQVKRVR